MTDILFVVGVIGFVLWIVYNTYLYIEIVSRIENAKTNWETVKAELKGVSEDKSDEKKGLLSKIVKKIKDDDSLLNAYAEFVYDNRVNIGVDKITLFNNSLKGSGGKTYIRRISRNNETEIDVYYNPEDPSDAVILPPDKHITRGMTLSLIFKYFLLSLFIYYVLV